MTRESLSNELSETLTTKFHQNYGVETTYKSGKLSFTGIRSNTDYKPQVKLKLSSKMAKAQVSSFDQLLSQLKCLEFCRSTVLD